MVTLVKDIRRLTGREKPFDNQWEVYIIEDCADLLVGWK